MRLKRRVKWWGKSNPSRREVSLMLPHSVPVILRSGTNAKGRQIHYLFNFSYEPKTVAWPYPASQSMLDKQSLARGQNITIEPWGVVIGEEK
jgi:beta-galactosidase